MRATTSSNTSDVTLGFTYTLQFHSALIINVVAPQTKPEESPILQRNTRQGEWEERSVITPFL